jgi:hypothetical protein
MYTLSPLSSPSSPATFLVPISSANVSIKTPLIHFLILTF